MEAPKIPFGKAFWDRFVEAFNKHCDYYVIACFGGYPDGAKIPLTKWSFERIPSVEDCIDFITRPSRNPSIVLWKHYLTNEEGVTNKHIHEFVVRVQNRQAKHLKALDNEMNRIITTLVNELESRNPRTKPKKLDEFIGRIPEGRNRAIEYRDSKQLGNLKYTWEPFAQETTIGTKTIAEWYDHYCERFDLAKKSIQQENDETYRPKPKPKPPKPSKPKDDKRPVHSEDIIAYPFKSKIDQYRQDIDRNVIYVEPPKQPRVQYDLLKRPYFSQEPGCWEIDHCFDMIEEGDSWMFCINVNTRYLVVYPIPETGKDVYESLKDLSKRFPVKSIRGDGSVKYCPLKYQNRVMTPDMLRREYEQGKFDDPEILKKNPDPDDIKWVRSLMRWYTNEGITIYFNSSPFTLHNKIVDVVIKTIRNAIGYRRMKPHHMDQLVNYYNNTVHKSIGCTPAFMQEHLDVEYQYIRWCNNRLNEILANQYRLGYLDYQPGNILMVHIDKGKTSEKHNKRRRFFDKLGVFVTYDHGNVVVDMLVNGVRVSGRSHEKIRIIVPIYHTKYVCKNIKELPKEYRDYYINSMDANFKIDDI